MMHNAILSMKQRSVSAAAEHSPWRGRFRALPVPSMIDELRIEPGDFDDYKSLARFHYKSSRPGAITAVIRMIHCAPTVVGRFFHRGDQTQTIGVLVRSLPQLSCQLRNIATANRYRDLKPRDAAFMLNREVRTISRVVIDPQWRGLGLAVKLVRRAIDHPQDERPGVNAHSPLFTEALAAMGQVSPFFEQAGMTRYDRPPRPEYARLDDALRHSGLEPFALASIATARAHIAASGSGDFLHRELRRWYRAAQRISASQINSMTIDALLIAARHELLSQPVYYAYRHAQSVSD